MRGIAKFNRVVLFAMSWLVLLGLAACKDKENSGESSSLKENIYTISLSAKALELDLFEGNKTLTATTLKNYEQSGGTVEWSSSDPDVIRVENGVLTPLEIGEALITAMWNGATATCVVCVNAESVPSLKIDCDSLGFIYGVSELKTLNPYVVYKDKAYHDNVSIEYEVAENGKDIVAVDGNGIVTPLGVGETEITISATWRNYNGIGMHKTIPVSSFYDFEVHAAVFDNEPQELYTKELVYNENTYSNKTSIAYTVQKMEKTGLIEIPNAQVEWKTSDESIATVSATGEVTAQSAGDVTIWCEYTYKNAVHKSNEVALKVYSYLSTGKSLERRFLFSKSDVTRLPNVSDVFGAEYTGAITGIFLNGKNIWNGTSLDIFIYADGIYTMDFVNEDGYAYSADCVVVSDIVEALGIEIGLVKGRKVDNVQYYNVCLPTFDGIEKLIGEGYKSLCVNYQYTTDNLLQKIVLGGKYSSEFQQVVTLNNNESLSVDLNVFIDRYDELDELNKSESLFGIDETDGKFHINGIALWKEGSSAYTNFKIDRDTTVSSPDGDFYVDNYVEKAGQIAELVATGKVSNDGRILFSSTGTVSKDTIGYWLDEGYNAFEVKYYLEYDATKMTKRINAYSVERGGTVIGEKNEMVGNQWATMTFSLGRFYAMRTASNILFALDAHVSDNGYAMDYTLYVESITAAKSSAIDDAIRMYAGSPVYMWTPAMDLNGENEYQKEVDGKTANIYTTFDVKGQYSWGCFETFFMGLNVTAEQLQNMQNDGYTKLSFELYAKTSCGADTDLRLNPEGSEPYEEQHKYVLANGEWTTISIDLNLLVEYYDKMNACGANGGESSFWSVVPLNLSAIGQDNVIYEFGIGEISATE